jgi:hypothetical protein
MYSKKRYKCTVTRFPFCSENLKRKKNKKKEYDILNSLCSLLFFIYTEEFLVVIVLDQSIEIIIMERTARAKYT